MYPDSQTEEFHILLKNEYDGKTDKKYKQWQHLSCFYDHVSIWLHIIVASLRALMYK